MNFKKPIYTDGARVCEKQRFLSESVKEAETAMWGNAVFYVENQFFCKKSWGKLLRCLTFNIVSLFEEIFNLNFFF